MVATGLPSTRARFSSTIRISPRPGRGTAWRRRPARSSTPTWTQGRRGRLPQRRPRHAAYSGSGADDPRRPGLVAATHDVDAVDVVGIDRHYCVRATAADAVASRFTARVLLDLTAGWPRIPSRKRWPRCARRGSNSSPDLGTRAEYRHGIPCHNRTLAGCGRPARPRRMAQAVRPRQPGGGSVGPPARRPRPDPAGSTTRSSGAPGTFDSRADFVAVDSGAGSDAERPDERGRRHASRRCWSTG